MDGSIVIDAAGGILPMKRTFLVSALAGLVGLSLCVGLVPGASAKNPMVSGQDARLRAQKLNETIEWNQNFEKVKLEAQRTNKPIFWMHMLGSINGHT